MLLNLLEYHWPEDIDDALLLLSRPDITTVPLAGGTHLLGRARLIAATADVSARGVGHLDTAPEAVVDLRDLDLAYITADAKAVHIGAMTTLQSIVDSPLLKDLAGGILSRAAHASSSSRLIRNSATIGGTLALGMASQADLLTALAVLDAEILLRSGSKTQINLTGGTIEHPGLALSGVTFKGKQERRMPYNPIGTETPVIVRPNELIIEVIIPRPASNCGASFMRIGRTPKDVALLNAAALIEVTNGIYSRVRLALGGVNMEPIRLRAIERQLEGQPIYRKGDTTTRPVGAGERQEGWPEASLSLNMEHLFAAIQPGIQHFQPPSDFRASSDYRRLSGLNLAYRALEEAANISYTLEHNDRANPSLS